MSLYRAVNTRTNGRLKLSHILFTCLAASPLAHRVSFAAAQHFPVCPSVPSSCPVPYTGLRFLQTSVPNATPGKDSRSIYTYRISASYCAKGRRLDPTRNLFNYQPPDAVKNEATPSGRKDKRARPASGQDAFFVNTIDASGSVAFGVADGVGGWTESGVDPADFAHGLCDYMASAAGGFPEGFKMTKSLSPRELLQIAYEKVQKDKTIHAGGSTAVVAAAQPDGQMDVANLGDSRFMHISLNAVRYFSEAQTHAFNTPYQLSKIPPRMRAQMALFGGALMDLPKDAAVTSHQLRHGDVLVFATDGVWDNLYPQDILSIVSLHMTSSEAWKTGDDGALQVSDKLRQLTREGATKPNNTLQALMALAVTREAKEASESRTRDGPFAQYVHRYYPDEGWHGGKTDDICVIVAVVTDVDQD